MEQLREMFKEKYGYYPCPDNSNPPEKIINRLKEYIFNSKIEVIKNSGKSNLGEYK